MNIAKASTTPSVASRNQVPLEQLAGNKTLSKTEKLAEASRQFEAMLLRQIIGAARKTVIKSSVVEDTLSSGIYQDMITDQLAESISRSGGFGLARGLMAQLQAQNRVTDDEAPNPNQNPDPKTP